MADDQQLDQEMYRKRLQALRHEIGEMLDQTQADVTPVALDQTQQGRLSRIDAIQRQEMAKEMRRRRAMELERVNSALKRLDEDEFGYCVACGNPIPAKRLELDPTVPLCIACAGSASS
ncbi:MAG: TraR/DksA family transcriptional regulator [Geminicoccaceae bacterium]